VFGVGLQPTVLIAQFIERFQTDGDAQQIGLNVVRHGKVKLVVVRHQRGGTNKGKVRPEGRPLEHVKSVKGALTRMVQVQHDLIFDRFVGV
jgi:hypothetical protein